MSSRTPSAGRRRTARPRRRGSSRPAAWSCAASEVVVIVPTRRAADGSRVLALPKGHVDPGETRDRRPPSARCARRPGSSAEPVCELGESRYWYRRDGRTIGKTVSFFLFDYLSGDTADHDDEVEEVRWIGLEEAETDPQPRRPSARWSMLALAYLRQRPIACRARCRSQLLLDDLRRRAQAGPQDGHDPPRRQVRQVPQEPGGAGHDRLPVLAARTDLRSGHRPGRGDEARRPLAARHQARQPRVPPPRGADQLPRTDLRPRGLAGGHRHGRALLADPRQPDAA